MPHSRSSAKSNLVSCRGITQIYKNGETERRVLDGVDCDLSEGKMIAIMGPSGSGKSTLLNISGALRQPTSGSVVVSGEALHGMNSVQTAEFRSQNIGFIFQEWNLIRDLTALENVCLPLRMRGISRKESILQARQAMRCVGVEDLGGKFPDRLSGGEQQRVAIARAVVGDKPLILADEPTGSLDRQNGHRVIELLRAVAVDERRGCLIATHDPAVAAACDDVWHVDNGHLEAMASA